MTFSDWFSLKFKLFVCDYVLGTFGWDMLRAVYLIELKKSLKLCIKLVFWEQVQLKHYLYVHRWGKVIQSVPIK